MISRKDNLLIRPWQQRKFENHRRKVQSALPAIDTSPPPYRTHVSNKLKKQQKENERCRRIEKDNLLLLQKLDSIMKTSRVDNSWKTSQPNFLNRIALYDVGSSKIDKTVIATEDIIPKTGKSKCCACKLIETDVKESKERITLESKKSTSKVRSKSLPIRKTENLPIVEKQLIPTIKDNSSKIFDSHPQISSAEVVNRRKNIFTKEPQSIILTRGSVKLHVNFPSDTIVQFQRGNVERILMKEICHCKNALMY